MFQKCSKTVPKMFQVHVWILRDCGLLSVQVHVSKKYVMGLGCVMGQNVCFGRQDSLNMHAGLLLLLASMRTGANSGYHSDLGASTAVISQCTRPGCPAEVGSRKPASGNGFQGTRLFVILFQSSRFVFSWLVGSFVQNRVRMRAALVLLTQPSEGR